MQRVSFGAARHAETALGAQRLARRLISIASSTCNTRMLRDVPKGNTAKTWLRRAERGAKTADVGARQRVDSQPLAEGLPRTKLLERVDSQLLAEGLPRTKLLEAAELLAESTHVTGGRVARVMCRKPRSGNSRLLLLRRGCWGCLGGTEPSLMSVNAAPGRRDTLR